MAKHNELTRNNKLNPDLWSVYLGRKMKAIAKGKAKLSMSYTAKINEEF
ncbi:MAG: hypothetical protein AAF810_05465 [Cyanobacteria bacterium P01_D01_bin.36]